MKDIQEQVSLFCLHHGLIADPSIRLLDVQSELGEVSKEILKATEYGRQKLVCSNDIAEELGDLQFALMQLANELQVNLDEAVNQTIRKIDTRIKKTGEAGSGS